MKWMFKEDHSLGKGGGSCYFDGRLIKNVYADSFLNGITVSWGRINSF